MAIYCPSLPPSWRAAPRNAEFEKRADSLKSELEKANAQRNELQTPNHLHYPGIYGTFMESCFFGLRTKLSGTSSRESIRRW